MAGADGTDLVSTFQRWLLAREDASRYNRNILQYAAAIAAIFGIAAGSGGILSIATSVEPNAETWRTLVPILVGLGVALVLSIAPAILLWRDYRRRGQAEREADRHLAQLVVLGYRQFQPMIERIASPIPREFQASQKL